MSGERSLERGDGGSPAPRMSLMRSSPFTFRRPLGALLAAVGSTGAARRLLTACVPTWSPIASKRPRADEPQCSKNSRSHSLEFVITHWHHHHHHHHYCPYPMLYRAGFRSRKMALTQGTGGDFVRARRLAFELCRRPYSASFSRSIAVAPLQTAIAASKAEAPLSEAAAAAARPKQAIQFVSLASCCRCCFLEFRRNARDATRNGT